MKKGTVINMKEIKLEGNILDISVKGNAVISDLISKLLESSNVRPEKDFMLWKRRDVQMEKQIYDTVLAFFSLNTLENKIRLNRLVREIGGTLKDGGRIIVWDVYGSGFKPVSNISLKVVFPDSTISSTSFRVYCNPLRPGFSDVLKILEKNRFEIKSSRINGNIYFIEAVKNREE